MTFSPSSLKQNQNTEKEEDFLEDFLVRKPNRGRKREQFSAAGEEEGLKKHTAEDAYSRSRRRGFNQWQEEKEDIIYYISQICV